MASYHADTPIELGPRHPAQRGAGARLNLPHRAGTFSGSARTLTPRSRTCHLLHLPRVRQTDAFGKTVSYDAEVLSRWGAFREYGGTVFADRQIFSLLLVLFVIAIVVFLVTGGVFMAAPPTAPLHTESYVTLLGMVSTLIGFVLGLYQSENLNRWRRLRYDLLGGLWGQIHNVSLLFGTWLKDEDATTTKDTVLRWALASHALLYYAAVKSTEEGLPAVKAAGLITAEELGLLEQQPGWIRAQVPWAWIASMGQALADSGRMPGALTALPLLLDKCMQARGCIGGVGSKLGTQLPFSYVHLLTWTVKSYLVMLAAIYGFALACLAVNIAVFGMAEDYRGASVRASNEWDAFLKIFLAGVVLVLTACFFQGILNVQVMLRNPFGGDPDDFRTSEDHHGMFEGGSALLMAGETMPRSWTCAGSKDVRVEDDSARSETNGEMQEKVEVVVLDDSVCHSDASSTSAGGDDALPSASHPFHSYRGVSRVATHGHGAPEGPRASV